MCLAHYNVRGSLIIFKKLISHSAIQSKTSSIAKDIFGLAILAKSKNEQDLYNELVKQAITLKDADLFSLLDFAQFSADPVSKIIQCYRIENISNLIAVSVENSVKATCHYNLGNIYRSKSNQDYALFHYFKSRKLNPRYLERFYWWQEVAGLLFLKKHHRFAELFYKKSIEIKNRATQGNEGLLRFEVNANNKRNLIFALLADSLFFQGKFSQALTFFQHHFQAEDTESSEWILKRIVCDRLIALKLETVIRDSAGSLKLCEDGLAENKIENIVQILNAAIKLDPVNGLAWFNMGIALQKMKQLEDSLYAFIVTSLVQPGDKEAQLNAVMISFQLGRYDMTQYLLHYMFEKHGQLAKNDISDYLLKLNIPSDARKNLGNGLNQLFDISLKDKSILKSL
jgi:tetratricopeptide (TPR) repeat protein